MADLSFNPASPFELATLGEVKRLEIRTRRILNQDVSGKYRSAFRGAGLIYSDLREYQPGDEVKNIHWKASARTGKVYVKSYEEDRSLNILLAVDVSNSTNFGVPRTKHIKAFEFAAVISMLAQKNGDALGICLFSDIIEEYRRPRRSRSQFQKIMFSLLSRRRLKPATSLKGALDYLSRHQKKTAVIFVVSDFHCPPFADELRRLAFKHDVICVSLEDALDCEMPKAGIAEFVDAETGERRLFDTSSRRARRRLKELYARRDDLLAGLCRSAGVDLIKLTDNSLTPLAQLMRQRLRRGRTTFSRPAAARLNSTEQFDL